MQREREAIAPELRKGKRMLKRAQAVAMETAKEILAPLDPNEVQELRRLLRKLAGVED